ncbi:MAG: two-component sensor histidine kinase [Paracoccaceae bacterium]|nr:MAG: two-component sensor histidine kinase [Paracoccaceae bacterium]
MSKPGPRSRIARLASPAGAALPVIAASGAALVAGLAGAGPLAVAGATALAGGAALALLRGRGRGRPVAGAAQDGARTPAEAAQALARLPLPLIAIGPGDLVAMANEAARGMFPRLAPGDHVAAALRAPAFLDALAEARATGAPVRAAFTLSRQGREHHLDARLLPDGTGRSARLLVLIEDRTSERRLDQMRADFVANASHELRTPLAAILGYIETLQGPARDDPAARDRFLATMARQAQRMQRLVEDLMSLSRIEMSEHLPPRDRCALAEVVREALAAVRPEAEAAGAPVHLRLTGAPVVPGDRDQLVQVFINLIDNALRHSPPGTEVTVASAPPSPSFPGMVGISVRDRGPGIAREHIPRLTERFYRVSTRSSRARGGTGLGLAIVKHVLNRHRGQLQIDSTPGEGSTFTVWLPAEPPPPEAGARH